MRRLRLIEWIIAGVVLVIACMHLRYTGDLSILLLWLLVFGSSILLDWCDGAGYNLRVCAARAARRLFGMRNE